MQKIEAWISVGDLFYLKFDNIKFVQDSIFEDMHSVVFDFFYIIKTIIIIFFSVMFIYMMILLFSDYNPEEKFKDVRQKYDPDIPLRHKF